MMNLETIIEYIRTTALVRIDGSGDYTNTVKKISRTFELPQTAKSYNMPAIYIVNNQVGAKISGLTGCEFTMGGNITNLMEGYPIELFGYISYNDVLEEDNEMDKNLNSLHDDIYRAMMTDLTFNGLITSCVPVAIQSRLIEQGDKRGIAYQQYMLKFDFELP